MVFDFTLEGKNLRWLTFGLFIFLICQAGIFLGLKSGSRFKYPTSSPFMRKAKIIPLESNRQCMTCDYLKPPLYNILDTDKDITALRQRHNSSLCCGPFNNVMQLLIQKEMLLQYYETSNRDSSILLESFTNNCDQKEDFKTPKAVLVGVVDSVPSVIVKDHSKLRWNKNCRTFTANNCIHLELEGEIFVKKQGYYIVSSTLNVNSTSRNHTPAIFSHNVNLQSHRFGTTGVLMQRRRTIRESDGVVFTSFMSAVFKFQKNDRISVSVSHPKYVARNSTGDNFNAYFTYDLN